jgi:very-short-patch-repair endonuclease
MDLDHLLRKAARPQRGVLTIEQAHDLGASESAIRHRILTGAFERLAPRIIVVGGVPLTTDLRRYAAWLECGGRSALSHETAAAHWRLPGFRAQPFHVVRLRDGVFPPVSLATVHTTRVLPDTQYVCAEGLNITTPTRTLFDLAARVHPGRLERLVDWAWSHRLTSWRLLDRTLRELQGRGRTGITVMRRLLDDRPATYEPPASNLEARFQKVLCDDGQEAMDRQVDIGDESRWIGRVDFVDRARKVIVEVQSDVHHTSVSDARDDAERRVRLSAGGWRFCEVREFEIWHGPRSAMQRIRQARSGR